jgi:hypothetical protein
LSTLGRGAVGNQVIGGWWWGLWITPAPTMPTSVRQTCRIAEPSDNSHLYLYRIVTQSRLGAHPRCSGLRMKQVRLANRSTSRPTLSANKKGSWPTISANSLQTTLRTKRQCKEHSLIPVFQEKDCFGLNRRHIQCFKYQYPEINHRAKRSFNLEITGRKAGEGD